MEMSGTVSSDTWLDPTDLESFRVPLRRPGREGVLALVDIPTAGQFALVAGPGRLELLPGTLSEVLAYRADLGDGRTAVNPILQARQEAAFAVDLTNQLDEETTTHWHGLQVPWEMDGHPLQAIRAGATRRYTFPVRDRGGRTGITRTRTGARPRRCTGGWPASSWSRTPTTAPWRTP